MPNIPDQADTFQTPWQASHVYAMAGLCLVIGVLLGYLFRGSQSMRGAANAAVSATTQPELAPGRPQAQAQRPTLEQMRHMADKKAEPLLAKLKAHPTMPSCSLSWEPCTARLTNSKRRQTITPSRCRSIPEMLE